MVSLYVCHCHSRASGRDNLGPISPDRQAAIKVVKPGRDTDTADGEQKSPTKLSKIAGAGGGWEMDS